MTQLDELKLAEKLIPNIEAARIPSNEVGKLALIIRRHRSVAAAQEVLNLLIADEDHFVRSAQTRRYSQDLSRLVLAKLIELRPPIDIEAVQRVLGLIRKLMNFRSATHSTASPGAAHAGRPVPRRP